MPGDTEGTQRLGFAFDSDFFEFGYVQIENATTNDTQLSDGAYRTLLVIREFAWKTGECYPGLARIAKMRGKTTVSIMTHISELVDCGYLEKQRRGQGKTNVYVIKTGRIRTLSPKENLSSKTQENLEERLLDEERAGISDAETSPTEKSAYASNERMLELLNLFRDVHWEYKRSRYMISWARDKKLAREMLATYSLDRLKDMMTVFFTQLHRQYSVPVFHRAIPELLSVVDDLRRRELHQKRVLIEAGALESYAEAHGSATGAMRSRLTELEQQIEEITSAGSQAVISNVTLREKLATLEGQVNSVWEDIHLRAVAVSGLPRELRDELERLILHELSTARERALALAAARRQKGGGRKDESPQNVPP